MKLWMLAYSKQLGFRPFIYKKMASNSRQLGFGLLVYRKKV